MKLTRRQRRFWFGLCFAVAAALILALFWGVPSERGSSADAPNTGASILRFGLLPYLEIDRTGVDISGQPMSDAASASVTINWPNLILTILVTILIALLLYFYGFTRLVKNTQLPHGLCDECGYDLRQSADQCPECGARIAPATR